MKWRGVGWVVTGLVCAAGSVRGGTVPRVPEPPQAGGEMARAWMDLLRREVAAFRPDLKPWDKDPRAKLVTDGRHTEHGIRPNAQPMSGFAAVARWSPDAAEREAALADLVALLRFVAATHDAGPLTASDGKKWKDQWQSALWAQYAGMAAWIVWDRLDADLRAQVEAMVGHEADRFLDAPPPFQILRDTKAEENAWNASVVSLAACMFPDHPRAAARHEAAVRWHLSSFLTAADAASDRVVDGRPLRDWKLGANVHPDYTMENHDRVHPSYMGTITLNQIAHLAYRWAGRPAPEALDFNTKPVYELLKFFSHPDGRMHFPDGQDWELHRLTPMVHAIMNVLHGDAEAACFERASLDTLRRMQARTGRTLLPQEYFFPSLPGMYVASYADAFLFHAWWGDGAAPASDAAVQRRLAGVRQFDAGKFIAHRTAQGWNSFAWGTRAMGLAIPFADDLLGSPYEQGFVGRVAVAGIGGKAARDRIESAAPWAGTNAFTVAAVLARAGGAVRQVVAMASLPDGSAVYLERLTAERALTNVTVETGAIGVLNEPEWPHQAGPRRLRWEGGGREIDGRQSAEPFDIPSQWVCIDDRWGFVALGAGGWRYQPNDKPSRGRREQILHLAPPPPGPFASGAVLAGRGLIVLPGRTADETAAVAAAMARGIEIDGVRMAVPVGGTRIEADLGAAPSVRITNSRDAPSD